MYITMPKLHITHTLFNTAAIFGVGLVWYDFNKKVYERVSHLLDIMWCETDQETEIRRREKEMRIIQEEKKRVEEEIKRLEEKKRIEEEEEEEAAGKTD